MSLFKNHVVRSNTLIISKTSASAVTLETFMKVFFINKFTFSKLFNINDIQTEQPGLIDKIQLMQLKVILIISSQQQSSFSRNASHAAPSLNV